nr:FAD-dependent monooxygenase [Fodinicola feengrottensis]
MSWSSERDQPDCCWRMSWAWPASAPSSSTSCPYAPDNPKPLACNHDRPRSCIHAGWLESIRTYEHATVPSGHFGGIRLDYSVFDTAFPFQIGVEQADVERFLEEHLATYDIPVLRGRQLTGLSQTAEKVIAIVDGHPDISAKYVVGADGAHSAVRKLTGFGFPGRDARIQLAVADLTFSQRPAGISDQWELPTTGGYLLPLRDGVHRFLFGGSGAPQTPVPIEEVQEAITAAYGPEAVVGEVRWASRFGDASRQADRYRIGRVLLAGDAAHIHLPAGGQGMNLGLQDAFNLGWKLAATVAGWAPPGLLDTYHHERHPVAAAVLANTRAQGVLTVPDPDIQALRAMVTDLLADPAANRRLAGEISGLDIQYRMPGGDAELLGRRMPDRTLADGSQLADHCRLGRALFVSDGWKERSYDDGRIDPLTAAVDTAFLVRPDGYVCWAGDRAESLSAAERHWFGAPQHMRSTVHIGS